VSLQIIVTLNAEEGASVKTSGDKRCAVRTATLAAQNNTGRGDSEPSQHLVTPPQQKHCTA
jgi:hypothetical protein